MHFVKLGDRMQMNFLKTYYNFTDKSFYIFSYQNKDFLKTIHKRYCCSNISHTYLFSSIYTVYMKTLYIDGCATEAAGVCGINPRKVCEEQ